MSIYKRPYVGFGLGFGLGFDALDISVQSTQGTSIPGVDFEGSIDFRYAGLIAYTKIYFDSNAHAI